MNNRNYTKQAAIRTVVLSTSASRYGRCDFPQGRKTGVTLVTSDCQYLFKVANKDVLFTGQNNPNGTVTLTNPAGFLSLTIAGSEVVRLAKKAKLDVDEIFLTPEELFELHEEPCSDDWTAPMLADADDWVDFTNAHLGSYYTPTAAPEPKDEADQLADFLCALPVTPATKPAPVLADADELAEALSPTKPAIEVTPASAAPSPAPTPRRRLSAKYKARITRKSDNYRGRFSTPLSAFQKDVALLWG